MELNVGGKIVRFDAQDAPLILAHKWSLVRTKQTVYARTYCGGRGVKMHRLLMPDVPLIDHRDGDGLNNRRDNLRSATHAQNTWNSRKVEKCSSRFKGVSKVRNRICSFEVSVTCNGYRKKLGRFHDEIAAALAYDITAVKLHGEFARPNFSIIEAALIHPKSLRLAIERCKARGVIDESMAARVCAHPVRRPLTTA